MRRRTFISRETVYSVMTQVGDALQSRINEKGQGSFASSHEILGVLKDELEEFRDEVHAKSGDLRKVEELTDIAVAAIFGIASITSGGCDW